jgi:anti-anti-sigma regulatory factor
MQRRDSLPQSARTLVVVRVIGELDDRATQRVEDDVRRQATGDTTLIVVSLARATSVRWDAVCRLGRAVAAWRAACVDVVVEVASPRLQTLLASVDGLSGARRPLSYGYGGPF